MANQQKIDYQFDERLRQVENALSSHLATCTERSDGVQKSLNILTKQVKLVDTSVNDFKSEMITEVSKAQGIAIGGKQVFLFSVGLVTTISLVFGIIQFLSNN